MASAHAGGGTKLHRTKMGRLRRSALLLLVVAVVLLMLLPASVRGSITDPGGPGDVDAPPPPLPPAGPPQPPRPPQPPQPPRPPPYPAALTNPLDCPRYAPGSAYAEPPHLYSSGGQLSLRLYYRMRVDDAGNLFFCYMMEDGLRQSPVLHVNPGDTLSITLINQARGQPAPSFALFRVRLRFPSCSPVASSLP